MYSIHDIPPRMREKYTMFQIHTMFLALLYLLLFVGLV